MMRFQVAGTRPEAVLPGASSIATGRTSAAQVGWVPAGSCALPTADQPLRLAEFDELFSAALRSVERPEATWLRLLLADVHGVEERARDLTTREAECCDFFDFSIHRSADAVVLDARVPAAHAAVLDGLARQAWAAATGAVR